MISSGSPHVRCTPMGRTCGEPDEIELTAMGVKLNGSRCRLAEDKRHQAESDSSDEEVVLTRKVANIMLFGD